MLDGNLFLGIILVRGCRFLVLGKKQGMCLRRNLYTYIYTYTHIPYIKKERSKTKRTDLIIHLKTIRDRQKQTSEIAEANKILLGVIIHELEALNADS